MTWTDVPIVAHITRIRKIHIDEIRAAIDGHFGTGGSTHPNATQSVSGFMSSTDKQILDGLAITAGTIIAVTGSLPIVSSGGTTPNISILTASASGMGAMSAADKIKLDSIDMAGVGIGSLNVTAPITSTGGSSPTLGILPASQSAAGSMSLEDKTKLDNMAATPKGTVLMFYPPAPYAITDYFDLGTGRGKSIAQGGVVDMSQWSICNGMNGTPNLIDRFPLGAGNKALGVTGGEAEVKLTEATMPTHTHSLNHVSAPVAMSLQITYQDQVVPASDLPIGDFPVEPAGGDQAHNNMPPYLVLWFIMRTH